VGGALQEGALPHLEGREIAKHTDAHESFALLTSARIVECVDADAHVEKEEVRPGTHHDSR